MNKRPRALWLALGLAGACAAPVASADTVEDAQVQTLLEMDAESRRAYLKSIPAEERRGLWWKVTQAKAASKGVTAQRGSYAAAVEAAQASAPADTSTTRTKAAAKAAPPVMTPTAVGTIQYDTGVHTTSFGGGAIIGNRFDTHTGIPVFQSGTVSTVQARVLPGPSMTTNSAGFVLLGPQIPATANGAIALAVFSTFTIATGTQDTVTFTGLGANYTGSEFFVLFGDFANSYVPAFGTETTKGQGHHGVVGYTGGQGPNITGTFDFGGTLNGLVRATGNIVPVELMHYAVE